MRLPPSARSARAHLRARETRENRARRRCSQTRNEADPRPITPRTAILYKLKLNQSVTTIPTVGFNVETVTYKNVKCVYATCFTFCMSLSESRRVDSSTVC